MSRKKTIAEKKKTGTYRPCKDGTQDPPQGVDGRPVMPKGLTPSQQVVFNETCDLLEQADWLRVSDGATIHAFSVMQDRLNNNQEEYTAADFTQFRMLANELGLSPAARAKMPIKPADEKQNDFDDL